MYSIPVIMCGFSDFIGLSSKQIVVVKVLFIIQFGEPFLMLVTEDYGELHKFFNKERKNGAPSWDPFLGLKMKRNISLFTRTEDPILSTITFGTEDK